MLEHLYIIAATETGAEGQAGLFEALGIDAQLIIVQVISFLILFLLLRKFVYPALIKAIDDRKASIEESARAAEEAKSAAETAEANTEKEFAKAKAEAADIVALAQKEASAIMEDAEKRAEKRADHMIASAEARLEQDVNEAREKLKAEMVGLVARATEIVLSEKVDSKTDTALIKKALEEVR